MPITVSKTANTALSMTDADKYYQATHSSSSSLRLNIAFYCDTDCKVFRGSLTEGDSSSGNDAYFVLPAGNALQVKMDPGDSLFFSCASAGKKIRTMVIS